MPYKIMLDPGHYGSNYNRSPVAPDYYESNMTWVLCHELKKELENYGFTVGTTRTGKEDNPSLLDRGKASKGYDLFISLHSDAAKDNRVDRVTVFYSFDNQNNSVILAEKLAYAIAETMEVSAGCVKTREGKHGREYYGVMNGARQVGTPLYYIVEHSFHTNKKTAQWLLDPNNLCRLAKVEAGLIASYFDINDFVNGDVNGDGVLSAKDYAIIKRAVIGGIDLTAEQVRRADIDGDGDVDVSDYTKIKRSVLGSYKI